MHKNILTAVVALLAATASSAGVLGVLIHSELTTTVTGMSAWKCTYSVAGKNVVVILRDMCPASREFE